MAREITINLVAQLANGSLKDQFAPGQIQINQGAALADAHVISLTTADTAITFTGISTNGLVIIQNLDATNYVQFGPNNAGAIVVLGRIKPGEFAFYRLEPGVTLRMQANTATCKVRVSNWND